MYSHVTDWQLIEILSGQRVGSPSLAWEEWLRRHGEQATVLAQRILRQFGLPPQLAEDVFQEASLQFFKNLNRLDPARPPHPYFIQTAKNAAWNVVRREVRFRNALKEMAVRSPAHQGDATVPSRDAAGDLMAVVSPADRVVMAAHYLEGLSADEIAAGLGRKVGQIYRQLHRARTRVREHALRTRRARLSR